MIEPLHITTREKLRRWYEENHDTAAEMIIPCSRAKYDKPRIIRYLDAVEEALCFVWIDRSIYTVDGVFHQRFSALNWTRCKRLEKLGLMTDAGRAAIPADIEQWLIPKDDINSGIEGRPCSLEELQIIPSAISEHLGLEHRTHQKESSSVRQDAGQSDSPYPQR